MCESTKNLNTLEVARMRHRVLELLWDCIDKVILEEQWLADSEDYPDFKEDMNISYEVYDKSVYVTLGRDGQSLEFSIYDDNTMGAICSEFCHKDYCILLISSLENSELDFQRLKEDMELLIYGFVMGNWHRLMDFLCHGNEWHKSFEAYLESEEEDNIGDGTTYYVGWLQ